ncbi:hypothetical protein [Mesorhizobium sp.]|nr:hypothetical protein [Mesorhizobium sp.]
MPSSFFPMEMRGFLMFWSVLVTTVAALSLARAHGLLRRPA